MLMLSGVDLRDNRPTAITGCAWMVRLSKLWQRRGTCLTLAVWRLRPFGAGWSGGFTLPDSADPNPPCIVVVGSINMDLVVPLARLPRPGETVSGRSVIETPGGKGANQAVAAAQLGAHAVMIGRVGQDAFGPRLRSELAHRNVDTQHVLPTSGPSGVALIGVEDSGQNAITIVAGANDQLTPDDVHARVSVIAKADALLLQLEVPIETVVAAAEIARAHGVLTVLDPAPCPAAPLPDVLHAVDVITPNQTEAEGLTAIPVAGPDAAARAARALLDRGAKYAVIKLGKHGALLLDRDHPAAHIAAIAVDPVDTTAAGDAFTAAMALAWARGDAPLQAVRMGCAAGTLATTKLGAQPAMPTAAEVDQFMLESQSPPSTT